MTTLPELLEHIDEKHGFDVKYLGALRTKVMGEEETEVRLIFEADDGAMILKLSMEEVKGLNKNLKAVIEDG